MNEWINDHFYILWICIYFSFVWNFLILQWIRSNEFLLKTWLLMTKYSVIWSMNKHIILIACVVFYYDLKKQLGSSLCCDNTSECRLFEAKLLDVIWLCLIIKGIQNIQFSAIADISTLSIWTGHQNKSQEKNSKYFMDYLW